MTNTTYISDYDEALERELLDAERGYEAALDAYQKAEARLTRILTKLGVVDEEKE